MTRPMKKIITYLAITFAMSAVFYALILSAGTLQAYGGALVLGLMWTPGVAGIVTQLLFEHTLRGMGWKPGRIGYLLLAYAIPLLYCLVVYGTTWISGLGTFSPAGVIGNLSENPLAAASSIAIYVVVMATGGVLGSMLSALGEEIGWRGLLVPELAKITSFPKTALFSGVIWTLWHLPLIFFADYNLPGVPKWYAGLMFSVMVIGISFAFAWLRLRSGSLWTAALLHASHNLFVQGVFTPFTGMKSVTPYIIDEFGIGLALAGVVLAVVFWRKAPDVGAGAHA